MIWSACHATTHRCHWHLPSLQLHFWFLSFAHRISQDSIAVTKTDKHKGVVFKVWGSMLRTPQQPLRKHIFASPRMKIRIFLFLAARENTEGGQFCLYLCSALFGFVRLLVLACDGVEKHGGVWCLILQAKLRSNPWPLRLVPGSCFLSLFGRVPKSLLVVSGGLMLFSPR